MSKLVTVRQAADLLGVSYSTMRDWLFRGCSPIEFRKTPSGRVYTTEQLVRDAFDNMQPHGMRRKTA